MTRTAPQAQQKRTHAYLTKLGDQENKWAIEMAGAAGVSVQTILRTLLREEMRRRKKRGA